MYYVKVFASFFARASVHGTVARWCAAVLTESNSHDH